MQLLHADYQRINKFLNYALTSHGRLTICSRDAAIFYFHSLKNAFPQSHMSLQLTCLYKSYQCVK